MANITGRPAGAAQKLGPWEGVYNPGYELVAYKNGDPSKPIRGVDWRSATRIATSKSIDDIVGTFDITMKDSRARELVGPMDVVKIRMRGHNQGWGTVLRGVTDFSGPNESASPTSAQQDTEVSGRCAGKYLQINSMFLPAWDPLANLPTALTFGVGDASGKLGTNVAASTPRAIFGYIFDHFVVGLRNRVGLSGTPNARFWLSRKNRFEWVPASNGKPFQVPFVQFDEDTCDTALTRLTIQGFTEGWVDEVGNIVYRRPGWDQPVSWVLPTAGLISDTLQDSDIGLPTYVEVFPGAMPAVSSGQAQALLAGRAPIPSDYVTGLRASGFRSIASPEFIIDVDATGKPTASGLRNWYYQRQKKYGLRPYQITSPLLASREQAQGQAEGLLRFMLRWQKSGTVTIPGEPNVRLGQTILLVGSLRGQRISRVYYISGIAHEYVEGDHYTTTLTLTHGRDPWDPHWVDVALPQFSASQLAEGSGILGGGAPSSKDTSLTLPTGTSSMRTAIVSAATAAVGGANFHYSTTRPYPSSLQAAPCLTDCSGFVTLCYKAAGAADPNGLGYSGQGFTGTLQQHGSPTGTPQPGDLVFWSTPDHVAVYIGGGQCVEFGGPPSPIQSSVSAESAYHQSFLGYRSYLP